jgi:ABC-2 type transport system ATP-binding protein
VDPISRRQFWDLIYELAGKGVTVFVTTHYMDEAEYCDRIALIYRGELIAMGAPAALKAEKMREDVIEVMCASPQDAMGFVEKLPAVKEAALFGRGLHIVSTAAKVAMPAIAVALRENNCFVERIEQIAPSMEDLFVSLIEARDRAERPQKEVRR